MVFSDDAEHNALEAQLWRMGIDQIPPELIQAWGKTYVLRYMSFIWIKDELPHQWKKCSIVPIYINIWGGWYAIVVKQLSNGKLRTEMLDKTITYIVRNMASTWR
jgi:hypothetical protein